MQHIEIHDPANCTIVNIDGTAGQRRPTGQAARVCAQCEQTTWRLTPTCMHCGFDRWKRYKVTAGAAAAAASVALVIFHPLLRG